MSGFCVIYGTAYSLLEGSTSQATYKYVNLPPSVRFGSGFGTVCTLLMARGGITSHPAGKPHSKATNDSIVASCLRDPSSGTGNGYEADSGFDGTRGQ